MQVSVYLCKAKCIFMQGIMVNRKLFEIFTSFSTFAQMSYLITFCFLAFSSVWIIRKKTKTETKKPHFCRFCRNMSVFVANKTLIISNIQVYRAKNTPTPPFLALAGLVSSSPKFFIFLFFIFVKYSDFINSAFLPNFENF